MWRKKYETYVIFICDFDPFGKKKYRYIFARHCEEDFELCMKEGCKSIFLSTRGENYREVPEELVKFLRFVKADLSESESDFNIMQARILPPLQVVR